MYLDHFGLAEEPFSVTSDPRFLFLSDSHEEALAHLTYCVEYRKGFAAITGEVGTGKTTLLNTLISRLDQQHSVAFVYQSAGSTIELMRYVFKDLGLAVECRDRTEYLNRFNDYLLQENAAGREVVLVVDEAQNLSIEVLEDLRLISNFEAGSKKLVQIILAGQSELGQKLRLPELRQLNQRIAIQYVLQPLGVEETAAYIQHRLKSAGASRVDIFQPKALKAIFSATGGVPRLINQVCDTAMLRTFSQKKQVISAQIVHDVVREDFQFRHSVKDGSKPAPTDFTLKRRSGLRLTIILAVSTLVVFGVAWIGYLLRGITSETVGVPADVDSISKQAEVDSTRVELERLHAELQSLQEQIAQGESHANEAASASIEEMHRTRSDRVSSTMNSEGARVQVPEQMNVDRSIAQTTAISAETSVDPSNPEAMLIRIREGDTIVKIAHRVYSYSDWELVQRIWELNPQIGNPNLIQTGDLLRIPRTVRSNSRE